MSYSHTNSKGALYYLNAKDVTLRGGRVQTIYFFTKEDRPATGIDLPDTHKVSESPNSGMLVLKKKEKSHANNR